MPDDNTVRQQRVARLHEARNRVSREKRARAVKACADLMEAGIPVTHSGVAQRAGVSGWLTYSVPEVRAAIENAQVTQEREGLVPQPARPASQRTTPASLRTDLANARQQVRELSEANQRLRHRLAKQLGVELEGVKAVELMERLHAVEAANRELDEQLNASRNVVSVQVERIAELEQENEAKIQALRAMMFARNTK